MIEGRVLYKLFWFIFHQAMHSLRISSEVKGKRRSLACLSRIRASGQSHVLSANVPPLDPALHRAPRVYSAIRPS
jgi:hypothetical protein